MAAGGTTTLVNLLKVKSNDLLVGNGVTGTGSLRVTIASDNTPISVNSAQPTTTGALTAIATGGQLTVGATILFVGQTVAIAGTNGGTGAITNGTYRISVTNGSTTFTLVNLDGTAITTTAGTPSGLTYSTYTPDVISNLSMMAGQTIAMGTGVRSAGTQRVTIATDDIVPVSQSGTWNIGTLTSITNALPTGTNSIGNIGTVSTLTSLTQFNGNAIATNTGVRSAGTLRVTIATDDVVPASQSGTWNINTLTSITNALPAGTNNIGDVDIASIAAGTNTIGKIDINQVYAEDAASAGGESLFLSGAVRQDTIAATTSADGDYTYLKTNNLGRLYTSTTIDAALPTGTNSIGNIGTVSTVTNLSQLGGTAIAMNTGVRSAGTQRVTIATDDVIGTVTTVSTVTNLSQLGGTAIAMNTGVRSAGTQRVTIATDDFSSITDSNNSSIVNLASAATYTGTGTDVSAYAQVSVTIFSDQNSGINGLFLQFSQDNVNWNTETRSPVGANVEITLSSPVMARYFRVFYQNSANITGAFRLQTRLHAIARTPSTKIATTTIWPTDQVSLTNSILSAPSTTNGTVFNSGVIKSSSTSAAATDQSLVVALSPNSPIPTGTNSIGNIGTVSTVTNLSQLGGTAIAMNTGVRSAGTQRVTIATDDVIGTVTSLTQFNGTAISMKAASTAPALADPALVVALSPNSQQLTTPATPTGATASTGGSLAQSTTYFFKIVAVDAGGGTTPASAELSFATAASGTATNTITLTWTPTTGADSYQVWWSTTTGTQGSYFPAPINFSTSGTLTNSYVFSTVTGTFSGTISAINTTSFARQKAIQPVSITPNQTITVTQATAANLNATVTGTVELGATSLAALENISVTVPGTVDLGTVSLTALETITVISGTPNNFQSKAYGAVTTAAPTYVTGNDNPLSLTTAGALRVDGSAVTQPVSIAASVAVTGPLTSAQTLTALTSLTQFNGTAISMKAASTAAVAADTALVVAISPNNAIGLAADDVHDGVAGTTGVMITGFASSATPTAVSADGDAARLWVSRNGAVIIDGYTKQGTATAISALNGTLTLQLGGSKAAGITITAISTPVGITLTPQVSFDGGTNWTTTAFKNLGNGDTFPTLTNANLIVGVSASIIIGGGASHVRVVALAYGSGSVTVQWSASESVDTRELFVASNNSAQRPISTAQVGGWDGTNLRALSVTTAGAVNIGSIASALPTGTNSIGNIGTVSTVTNLSQLGGTAIAMNTGVRSAGTLRVTIATDDVVPVTGPLTDTQLRATAVPVSGTVTANAGTGSFTVAQATASNLNATVSIAAAQTLTTVSTVSTVSSLTQMNGQNIAMGFGTRTTGTQRVTIATDDIVQTKATPDATGTYAGTNATTTVYATNLVVKASAGTVYMLSGYNSLATAQFIQLHNATALPADTSVPSVIFYVPGLSNFSFDFGVYGRFFSTGVVVCNSTTGPTKTIGAANCWFDAQFK
jgi:hypothetical protein